MTIDSISDTITYIHILMFRAVVVRTNILLSYSFFRGGSLSRSLIFRRFELRRPSYENTLLNIYYGVSFISLFPVEVTILPRVVWRVGDRSLIFLIESSFMKGFATNSGYSNKYVVSNSFSRIFSPSSFRKATPRPWYSISNFRAVFLKHLIN